MTLNFKIGAFIYFWRFLTARHILRANYVKITTDRPQPAAYKIFTVQVSTF